MPVADKQRHRLLAALVAACGLARRHRRDQALGERKIASRVVNLRGVLDHLRAREHVPATEKVIPAIWPHHSRHSTPV
jgi:hypothetical protein